MGDTVACSRPRISPFALVEVPLLGHCSNDHPEEERPDTNPWALISTSLRCVATFLYLVRNLRPTVSKKEGETAYRLFGWALISTARPWSLSRFPVERFMPLSS
jgi:hypothetical protein